MVSHSDDKGTHEGQTLDADAKTQPNKSSTLRDLALPFIVLIWPLRTFRQLAQRPAAKGLITLTVSVLLAVAAAQYAFASRMLIRINDQFTIVVATDFFPSWFANSLVLTMISILLYWSVYTSSFFLLGRIFGGKEISLRNSLLILVYTLSIFAILYAIRAVVYLALPSLELGINHWPPLEADYNYVSDIIKQNWSTAHAFQVGFNYFPLVALAWLVVLGTTAQKATREVSWGRALVVSMTGFFVLLFLFGPP